MKICFQTRLFQVTRECFAVAMDGQMMFADDAVICSESGEQVEENPRGGGLNWRKERKGHKWNSDVTGR